MANTPIAAPAFDLDALETLVGPVAAREFQSAEAAHREDLYAWAQALPTLTDAQFLDQAEDAIGRSALVSRFRGNWDHVHFKSSAVYFESARRWDAEHVEDCTATTLYQRAYNRVVRSEGHSALAEPGRPCTCPRD